MRLAHRKNKKIALFVLSLLILASPFVYAIFEAKKLIVVANNAPVHLEPDRKSTVIATLDKGSILTLSSNQKFRRLFNYVYFISEKTGCTKSGYIHDLFVNKLFNVTKVITIQGQSKHSKKSIQSELFLDNIIWNMNSSQLRDAKGEPVHEGQSHGYSIIGYQKKIMNRECLIGYYFERERFVGAKFSFIEQRINKNQNIVDYKKIKELMIQKYGKPVEDNISWNDAEHKNNIEEWGDAIGMGHLKYLSRWKTMQTEVLLKLCGTDESISLELTYRGTP